MDRDIKRIFIIGVIFILALWFGVYVQNQMKLHAAEQRFMHNSYQPLRGNQ